MIGNVLKISKRILLLVLLPSFVVHAQSPEPPGSQAATWFTVMGEPNNFAVNTIQVDPVDRDGNPKTMQVRISRSTPRTSWDGVPYRSYTATVDLDCERNQARYINITYYAQPGWQGAPGRAVDYSVGTPRRMVFQDVTPNPTQRIINAACKTVGKR